MMARMERVSAVWTSQTTVVRNSRDLRWIVYRGNTKKEHFRIGVSGGRRRRCGRRNEHELLCACISYRQVSTRAGHVDYQGPSGAMGNVLLIDNYDSYTYNLVHLIAKVYGSAPIVYRNDEIGYEEILRGVKSGRFDSVIISPGPGTPENDNDIGVCRDILQMGKFIPVLGVCLGHQAIAYLNGAAIRRAPEPFHGRKSRLKGMHGPLFHKMPTSSSMAGVDVIRYHSLDVDPESLPDDGSLIVTAWADDSDLMDPSTRNSQQTKNIMAICHCNFPHYGVQFHPESIASIDGMQLISNFQRITNEYWRKHSREQVVLSCYSSTQLIHAVKTVSKLDGRRTSSTISHVHYNSKDSPHSWKPILSSSDTSIQVDYIKMDNFLHKHDISTSQIFWEVVSAVDPDNCFWLDSSSHEAKLTRRIEEGAQRSRFSYMGSRGGRLWKRLCFKLYPQKARSTNNQLNTGIMEIENASGDRQTIHCRFFDFIDEQIAHLKQLYYMGRQESIDEFSALPFDFWGGFVGYLGYELKAECEGNNRYQSRLPDATLYLADRVIVADHEDGSIYLLTLSEVGDIEDKHGHRMDANEWMEETRQKIMSLETLNHVQEQELIKAIDQSIQWNGRLDSSLWRRHDSNDYVKNILRCKEAILEGQSYELCLTNELMIQFDGEAFRISPSTYYRLLRQINPAPYSAYFTAPATISKGLSICCSSPERFLKLFRDGKLEAKPIKGTVKRECDPQLDSVAKDRLQSSKEQAENLMIVDLLRNDLSRVCQLGTVCVPKLMHVESYATVHQLVSTVYGRVLPIQSQDKKSMMTRSESLRNVSAIQCVKVAFPGGSMTGAPKIRSMHILDEIEDGPRGIYSGSLGFFSINGTSDLNIVIRTAVFEREYHSQDLEHYNQVSIGAGGAITHLSKPQMEVDEVMLKAEPLLIAAAAAAAVDTTKSKTTSSEAGKSKFVSTVQTYSSTQ